MGVWSELAFFIIYRVIAGWLLLSSIVVVWDASFILLRPHSLPKGDLDWFWMPYRLYIEVDMRYNDMKNDFVIAQSWCNLIEVVLNMIAVVKLFQGKASGMIIGFLTSVMTFWKTLIYLLQYTPLCTDVDLFGHMTWSTMVWFFIVPNGIWVLIPLLVLIYLGRRMNALLSCQDNVKKKY